MVVEVGGILMALIGYSGQRRGTGGGGSGDAAHTGAATTKSGRGGNGTSWSGGASRFYF